jgi:simple sugar transport system permease protein
MWSEGMSAGRGWIALALVVFASWKAERILLGAYLFGAASIMHLVLQGLGFEASPNLLAMLPYGATIIVLVIIASDAAKAKLSTPLALGQPYRPQV